MKTTCPDDPLADGYRCGEWSAASHLTRNATPQCRRARLSTAPMPVGSLLEQGSVPSPAQTGLSPVASGVWART